MNIGFAYHCVFLAVPLEPGRYTPIQRANTEEIESSSYCEGEIFAWNVRSKVGATKAGEDRIGLFGRATRSELDDLIGLTSFLVYNS
jgi:hypothetical protein